MKTTLTLTITLLLATLIQSTARPESKATGTNNERTPQVQIAILLDTSGSMSGLIEQTKGQLWKIVNEFINAKQHGQRPDLRVALYEYGKSSLPKEEGWLRMIQPLTTDLDKISEELFVLKTNGGSEYCGWVIREATRNLEWSKHPDDFKAIFIAGNEPFTQGPVSYKDACKEAIAQGIVINTIHCGAEVTGIKTAWKDGALLADGKFMFINHNKAVVHFAAPQDEAIAKLGVELNKTYVAFGQAGKTSLERQRVQDVNSLSLASQGAAVQRALCKASANYVNSRWDLVDACKNGKVKLADLKESQLPEELKKLTPEQRKEYIQKKTEERTRLQTRINELNSARNKFIAEKRRAEGAKDTLDSVIISTIREQAGKQNYQFE